MKSRQTTANHHQNTSKKESNCQFCGLNLVMARRNIIYLCHSCCLHDFSICKQLFYIEKHCHVCNNQDWVCVAPPIEYAWCQFKMTSSKCPYRSKHQVIILTVYISPWNLVHHTKQARHAFHRHTNTHRPKFCIFTAFRWWFVVVCLQG